MTEPITVRRKRLTHASRYRGFLESDLFFGRFADQHLHSLDKAQLDRYEALLQENDHDLFAWIAGRQPVPPEHDNDVMTLLRRFEFTAASTGA
ncbi:succinate dehydrogenase assembly factor 2 [Marinivivus vitaminiproducens]|uniref:succinate dehydrogenase assembly factor 2 n=1 Tax=Marinivivus vitaminiproducens TaxID=3035935 RepID=UPI00279FF495|nr:succinate dehydrogenase assembly factor 2 [Geminicoccaceae bacterium SCSIO 64248]